MLAIYIQSYGCQVAPFLGKIPDPVLERKQTETTKEFVHSVVHFFADTVAITFKIDSSLRCRVTSPMACKWRSGLVVGR